MSNRIDTTISKEEFEFRTNRGKCYEGYVLGMGYVFWIYNPTKAKMARSNSVQHVSGYQMCLLPNIQSPTYNSRQTAASVAVADNTRVSVRKVCLPFIGGIDQQHLLSVVRQQQDEIYEEQRKCQETLKWLRETEERKIREERARESQRRIDEFTRSTHSKQGDSWGGASSNNNYSNNNAEFRSAGTISSDRGYSDSYIMSSVVVPSANMGASAAITLGQELSLAGQGLYVTSKGIVRPINYTKLTLHSAPYARAGKLLRGLGRFTFVLGIALDANQLSEDRISGAKFGLNSAVSTWGFVVAELGGGLYALPAVIGYFAIDMLYDGGWPQALREQREREEEVRKILGDENYREFPIGPKW